MNEILMEIVTGCKFTNEELQMNEVIEKFLKQYPENDVTSATMKRCFRDVLVAFITEYPVTVWQKIESEKDCPDNARHVFIYTKKINGYYKAYYFRGLWTDNEGSEYTDVIAWTELPEHKGN